jgi:formylglycine-generating enzyme required for sulfatase activity
MTVTIDTGWHPLVDGSPPDWASAWGQDRFGVYVAFQIGAATQRLRWIPPGRFWMGSPEDEAGRGEDEGPRHEVTLESGFWLFDTPCTQALWEAVMGGNPSRFVSPTRPVEQVSFEDAERFLARVNERVPKLDLVLPSEAQWEYACRAGTETASYAGAMSIVGEHNAPVLDAIAWYGGNSGIGFELENGEDSSDWPEKQYDHAKAGTRPVGLKAPNPWGLHDMLGNVWEWTGTAGAADRVFRGGSWHGHARSVRAASRSHSAPSYRDGRNGFRCARVQSANVLRGAVRKETSRNTLIRLPITIATGNCFTLNLLVGSQATPVNVLLDTGSSMTAVNIDAYDPGTDPAAVT